MSFETRIPMLGVYVIDLPRIAGAKYSKERAKPLICLFMKLNLSV